MFASPTDNKHFHRKYNLALFSIAESPGWKGPQCKQPNTCGFDDIDRGKFHYVSRGVLTMYRLKPSNTVVVSSGEQLDERPDAFKVK